MEKGTRHINGKYYLLAGRVSSKESAMSEAHAIRKQGKLARIIKLHDFDYMIYEF